MNRLFVCAGVSECMLKELLTLDAKVINFNLGLGGYSNE